MVAEEAAEVTGVHQIEPANEVGQDAAADDEGVLEQDVGRVLRAGETRLHHGETEMHDEDQRGRHHHPDVVGREQAR